MKNQLPQMPTFTQKINVPAGFATHVMYFRYYSSWGDGGRAPVSDNQLYWPEVILPDASGKEHHLQASTPSPYLFSQYANVAIYYIDGSTEEREIIVRGSFEQAAYCSLSIYNYEIMAGDIISQQNIQGQNFTMDEGENPFIPGNPSVFAYERPEIPPQKKQEIISLNYAPTPNLSKKDSTIAQKYDFFRPTAEMARSGDYGRFESIAEDGCSPDYLYATPSELHDVYILKIKVPTTFIHSNNTDLVYAGYQAQELVIDSFIALYAVDSKYSFAVTSRQLNDYKDGDGYAYVFFMPLYFVHRLCEEQNTPYKIPPIYTLEGVTGYVLPVKYNENPRENFINIRHRGSSSAWEGCLTNTQCFLEDSDLQPISPSDLGEYYPELYGDTMENFLAGKTGIINKKKSDKAT